MNFINQTNKMGIMQGPANDTPSSRPFPGVQYSRENMAPMGITASMSIDEVARDLIGNSAASIVGEVMNLDDFLDEVSDPDPKYGSPRSDLEENNPGAIGSRVFNPLANLDMMINTSNYHYEQQQQSHFPSFPTTDVPVISGLQSQHFHNYKSAVHDPFDPSLMKKTAKLTTRATTTPLATTATTTTAPTTTGLSCQRKRSQSMGSSAVSLDSPHSPFVLPAPTRPASASLSHSDPDSPGFDPRTRAFSEEELRPQPILRKRKKQYVSDEMKNEQYWKKRIKNNTAARKSREAKRLRENQILLRAQYLEEENAKLREELQVQTTEKEDMKTAILQLNQRLLQNPPVISEAVTVRPLSSA